jgi:hypothetical protein
MSYERPDFIGMPLKTLFRKSLWVVLFPTIQPHMGSAVSSGRTALLSLRANCAVAKCLPLLLSLCLSQSPALKAVLKETLNPKS